MSCVTWALRRYFLLLLNVGVVQRGAFADGDEVHAPVFDLVVHVVVVPHVLVDGHDEFSEKVGIRVLGDLGVLKNWVSYLVFVKGSRLRDEGRSRGRQFFLVRGPF